MEEQVEGSSWVCGGSWWKINPYANLFHSSSCSSTSIDGSRSFGWPSHDLPAAAVQTPRSSLTCDSAGSASDGPGSVVIRDVTEQASVASTLETMGINQDFIHENNGKSEENYAHTLPAAPAPVINPVSGMDSFRQNPGFQFDNPASFNYGSPLLQPMLDGDQPGSQSTLINYGPEYHPTLLSRGEETQHDDDIHDFHFSNNASFWNGLGSGFVPASGRGRLDVRPSYLHDSGRPNFLNVYTKQHNPETGRALLKSSTAAPKKGGHEAGAAKRHRAEEIPSPLPAFKVRKEKLGDRVTALQQLVSPFGKTDTASVLHEAFECIKFLHDQLGVLSTSYLKNGSPQPHHQQDGDENVKMKDLKSRGLCLVPTSNAFFPETAHVFWTPTFGAQI